MRLTSVIAGPPFIHFGNDLTSTGKTALPSVGIRYTSGPQSLQQTGCASYLLVSECVYSYSHCGHIGNSDILVRILS